jgi:hypothetical protein
MKSLFLVALIFGTSLLGALSASADVTDSCLTGCVPRSSTPSVQQKPQTSRLDIKKYDWGRDGTPNFSYVDGVLFNYAYKNPQGKYETQADYVLRIRNLGAKEIRANSNR